MLSQEDLRQIAAKGITEAQVETQLEEFKQGFPFLRLEAAAAVGNGIAAPGDDDRQRYIDAWNAYKAGGKRIVKFVPASGAASRMFKDMFAFLNGDHDTPQTDFEKKYFDNIERFAFYGELNEACKRNEGKDIPALMAEGRYKDVVANMLEPKGLNYGQLPKGLLLFHKYAEGPRTPLEEHLVEGALYAASGGEAHIHFTVSHEHRELFKAKVNEKCAAYAAKYGIKYDVTFSEQKPSTDTIAANPDNTPFRNEDGSLLFRPGGHGALIQNLNDIDADVVFIKNIDNVVPDRLKGDTVTYKQLIAGILVTLQAKAFEYLRLLDTGEYTHEQLEEIIRFVQRDLCCRKADIKQLEDAELVVYLHKKLDRPMRVCGVVKNVGEPGGGPFLTYNQDGTGEPANTRKQPDRQEQRRVHAHVYRRNPLQPGRPCMRRKGLQGQPLQPARLRGQVDRLHQQQEQERARAEGARAAGPVERRDERLEHHLRGSSIVYVQPSKDS